jgi:D-sedoheptulose 7-phosphate isomerase
MSKILHLLKEHLSVMSQLESLFPAIEQAANAITRSIERGGKILLMGNGGSAADAQHLAAELVGRFKAERVALPAIALTTDSSILTSVSNDYGYAHVFARQLEAFCQKGDVVIAISTSGSSPNIIKGIETAKKRGAFTIGLTGARGNTFAHLVDLSFVIPSENVARIQEAHIFMGHIICELVDEKFIEEVRPLVTLNATSAQ